jgi:hypothetical protein
MLSLLHKNIQADGHYMATYSYGDGESGALLSYLVELPRFARRTAETVFRVLDEQGAAVAGTRAYYIWNRPGDLVKLTLRLKDSAVGQYGVRQSFLSFVDYTAFLHWRG